MMRTTAGAERLREWREKEGLTQREAAQKLGFWEHQISRYETGRHKPSIVHALAIARLTDGAVPVDVWC